MLSYGGTPLIQPSAALTGWIEANIPPSEAFGHFRPKSLGDPLLNPRAHFAWVLSRPVRVNSLFNPWGAARWGMAYVLANAKMLTAIRAQVYATSYAALPFVMDNGVGESITTNLWMLPPVPLTKIAATPSLPTHLVPLVDERYFFWERAGEIEIDEGTTSWEEVYDQIAGILGITLSVDPVSADYLFPSAGLAKSYQHLPPILDWVAASVGQRIVRTLAGDIIARSATSAAALMTANAALFRKSAGGSLELGAINA